MLSAQRFQKTFQYLDLFWQGIACTVSLSALTVIFGFVLALILALARLSNIRAYNLLSTHKQGQLSNSGGFLYKLSQFNPVSFFATLYVEVFRATPLLVQLFIIYYVVFADISILPGFKLFGFIRFERFFPGVVALALNSGAYLSEIIRSGIQSIDGGQTEAARSLGMSQLQNMRHIVLPQAIKNILPAIANEFVTIIKESSICYTIGVQDIMSAVAAVKGATFSIAEPLVVATVLYFCLTFPTSKIIAHFERKMSVGDSRNAITTAKKLQKFDDRNRKSFWNLRGKGIH
ncbi:MAG: amino acid ABC transporter permease [Oscillospiraceae bacterium]|nr:amino acid ABC transporter permease [Oscillospiraceae bacterium]